MREYLTLGSTPCDEECAQLGSDDYAVLSRIECHVFKHQLQRMFPKAKDMLTVKSFPHDFGTYREVCIVYNTNDDGEAEVAFEVENDCPIEWDELAKKEYLERIEALKNEGYQFSKVSE